MKVVPKEIAELKRRLEQMQNDTERQGAIMDYNIMMGNLEDPAEEGEDNE